MLKKRNQNLKKKLDQSELMVNKLNSKISDLQEKLDDYEKGYERFNLLDLQ